MDDQKDNGKTSSLETSAVLHIQESARRATNLEGIMSSQQKSGGFTSLTSFNSPNLGPKVNQSIPELSNLQQAPPSGPKKPSLVMAKQLADNIQLSYSQMIAHIEELQKETGMIVKTQDLEKEFNKVFARVKVIGKL